MTNEDFAAKVLAEAVGGLLQPADFARLTARITGIVANAFAEGKAAAAIAERARCVALAEEIQKTYESIPGAEWLGERAVGANCVMAAIRSGKMPGGDR